MTRDVVISVKGLAKRYTRGPESGWTLQQVAGDLLLAPYRWMRGQARPERHQAEPFWALRDLTFDVERGEKIAIIGRNGAGKSTFLKILSRVVYPTDGEVRIRGRVTSLLEVGTGFNENLTGRVNVYLNASMHGLSRKEIDERFEAIVEFAQVGPFIDTPIKRYSTGMRARLAFAVAAHLDPDILIMDEVLAVGDLAFQRKCLQRVQEMANGETTLLFVSHSMDAVVRFCSRGIWLEAGRVVADGPVREVATEYSRGVLEVQSEYVHHPREGDAMNAATPTSRDGQIGQRDVHAPEPQTSGVSSTNGSTGHDPSLTATAVRGAAPTRDLAESRPVGEVRLIRARVISRQGLVVSIVPLDEQAGVEIDYEVIGGSILLVPAIYLNAPDGTLVFAAVAPDADPARMMHAPGRYQATVWLPAHFVNVGPYTVGIALVGPDETPLRRYVQIQQALSFVSVEAQSGGARGLMPREFPGVIRPLLDWNITSS